MLDEIDEAAVKAIRATNFCLKHRQYHGQKFKSCTPQRRTLVKIMAKGIDKPVSI